MSLDPSVGCDQSFGVISPSDVKYLVASGSAGVAGTGGYDYLKAGIEKDGTLSRFFPHGIGKAYFDYQVPAEFLKDLVHPSPFIIANNKRVTLLSLIDYDHPESFGLLAFRKSDKTWHRLPAMGEGTDEERAFGEFIAVAGALRRAPGVTLESQGKPEWRSADSTTGPSMLALFHSSRFVFPGHLFLYDVSTEHLYTIDTHQGDSEILLVEDRVVYYRASDRLYSATITETGLTPGRLLATSEVIRDAHWAFLKH